MARKPNAPKSVVTLKHGEATRKNIPTAEYQSVMQKGERAPVRVTYPRGNHALDEEKEQRNRDLDPQLIWRGKGQQDWSDLVVNAPPPYIQEKVHPKVLIDDLKRESERQRDANAQAAAGAMADLFADFNGLPDDNAKTEFYQHDAHWANRMILGDSLQVMASLAEREGLRGKVQCIYLDPPYGIKFNSNFQWSTTSRDVKDGNTDHITREPEQVKAFRDTWRDGIHSYLTYLRDRLMVARDLLTESGSIFVQIGDENVHRVRDVLDEIFGESNFASLITVAKTTGAGSPSIGTDVLASVNDFVLWYARSKVSLKYRQPFNLKTLGEEGSSQYTFLESPDAAVFRKGKAEEISSSPEGWRIAAHGDMTSQTGAETTRQPIKYEGRAVTPSKGGWKTNSIGSARLAKAKRLVFIGNTLRYRRKFEDFIAFPANNYWADFRTSGFSDAKTYVVQTNPGIIQRCVMMTTDPGDLVLDPTCGSGTTAYVAEQWGRRWITVDTSRVALALARARIMGARYPFYLLADSRDGQLKEAEVTRSAPSSAPTRGNIAHGFVYERVPHITLKSIANDAEIDVIWNKFQQTLERLREALNEALGKHWQEWEISHESGEPWSRDDQTIFLALRAEQQQGERANPNQIDLRLAALNKNLKCKYTLQTLPERPADPWPAAAEKLHADWWQQRIARQREIDASIAAKADNEFLYDKPYEDKKKVRVAGPFTVESLSPHRVLGVDEDDELIDPAHESGVGERGYGYGAVRDFTQMILENLKTAGVQQAHKDDKITFTSLVPWPGDLICAEGRYLESGLSPQSRGGRGSQKRETRRHLHRPRIRHRLPPRPGAGRP